MRRWSLNQNLTSDGHWTYSWDAENRLTSLEEKTSTRQPPNKMPGI
jgi:hypothetical protein